MNANDWVDLGAAADFAGEPLTAASIGKTRIVVTCVDGEFGVISAGGERLPRGLDGAGLEREGEEHGDNQGDTHRVN